MSLGSSLTPIYKFGTPCYFARLLFRSWNMATMDTWRKVNMTGQKRIFDPAIPTMYDSEMVFCFQNCSDLHCEKISPWHFLLCIQLHSKCSWNQKLIGFTEAICLCIEFFYFWGQVHFIGRVVHNSCALFNPSNSIQSPWCMYFGTILHQLHDSKW